MKITFSSIVAYLIGIPAALVGLLLLFTSPVAGFVTLLTGLFILPITRRRAQAGANLEFSRGAVVGIALVGLLSSGVLMIGAMPESAPGEDVSNVTVYTSNYDYDGADYDNTDERHELAVSYNTRAQPSVNPNPDSMTHYDSDDGEKYLVVRMEVENQGDIETEIHGSMFKFESDNVVYDRQALFGSGNNIGSVTLNPGGSATGWVAFTVPEDVTEGTLQVDGEGFYPEGLIVEFDHDESMAIEMDE